MHYNMCNRRYHEIGGTAVTFLWIFLGILALLALLLATPLRIFLLYSAGELNYRVKYGFFPIFDSQTPEKEPKKPKKSKRSEKTAPKEKKSGAVGALMEMLGLPQLRSAASAKNAVKENGLLETIRAVLAAVRSLFGRIGRLLKKGVFRHFDLSVRVADGDPAEAALKYGQICAAVYPLLHLLENTLRFSRRKVEIFCDDELTQTQVEFSAQLNYRLWHIVCFLCGLLGNYIKNRKDDPK